MLIRPVIGFSGAAERNEGPVGNPGKVELILIGVGLWVLHLVWAVHRAQDIGRSKLWCLLLQVPVVNLVTLLALLLWPSRKIKEQQEKIY